MLLELDRRDELETFIDRHVADHPQSMWAPHFRAILLRDAEQWEDVIAVLRPALAMSFDHENLRTLLRAIAHLYRGDFAAAADVLDAHRAAIIDDEALRQEFEYPLLVALADSERLDAALEVAQASTARDGDPYDEVLVLARMGRTDDSIAAFERCIELGYEPAGIYDHPLADEALRDSAYQALHTRYPVPVAEE